MKLSGQVTSTDLSSNQELPFATMNTIIEIHDSTVAEITQRDGTVTVHFLPAILHQSKGRPGFDSGTIWTQEARLIFSEASVSGEFPDWPCDLMGGELVVGNHLHDNLIPVPLESSEVAKLRLICDSIHTVLVDGQKVRLEMVGEPKYLEEFTPHHSAT